MQLGVAMETVLVVNADAAEILLDHGWELSNNLDMVSVSDLRPNRVMFKPDWDDNLLVPVSPSLEYVQLSHTDVIEMSMLCGFGKITYLHEVLEHFKPLKELVCI